MGGGKEGGEWGKWCGWASAVTDPVRHIHISPGLQEQRQAGLMPPPRRQHGRRVAILCEGHSKRQGTTTGWGAININTTHVM